MYRTRTLPGPLLHHARTVPVPTMIVAPGPVMTLARAGSQSPREASRIFSRTGCFCGHGQVPRSAGWCHVALAHGVPGSGLPDRNHGHSRVGFRIKIYRVQRFQIRLDEKMLIFPPTGRIQCFRAKYRRSPDANGNPDTNWLRSRPPSGSAAVRSNVRTNPWQQVSRCSQIQVSTVWRRISSRSRHARRDSRIVMAQRLSQLHTRFAGHGVGLLEPAGLGFLHCRFQLPLQRVELPRAVAFHEHPEPGAHDLAQVGVGAGIDPLLGVTVHLVGQVNLRHRGISPCPIMAGIAITVHAGPFGSKSGNRTDTLCLNFLGSEHSPEGDAAVSCVFRVPVRARLFPGPWARTDTLSTAREGRCNGPVGEHSGPA